MMHKMFAWRGVLKIASNISFTLFIVLFEIPRNIARSWSFEIIYGSMLWCSPFWMWCSMSWQANRFVASYNIQAHTPVCHLFMAVSGLVVCSVFIMILHVGVLSDWHSQEEYMTLYAGNSFLVLLDINEHKWVCVDQRAYWKWPFHQISRHPEYKVHGGR